MIYKGIVDTHFLIGTTGTGTEFVMVVSPQNFVFKCLSVMLASQSQLSQLFFKGYLTCLISASIVFIYLIIN